MKIGIPKEIKNHESRVGMTPPGVNELTRLGHQVFVEKNAGLNIGITDLDYKQAGAVIAKNAEEVFKYAELIVKVKEPQKEEIKKLQPKHTLFTYLHLAPDSIQTQGLLNSGAKAIAYETVTDRLGSLPLLAPMSEVAGRMAVQAGAMCLEIKYGGRGVLLGGVPGVTPGKVTIIGGGVVGSNAALIAAGMGAQVSILDNSIARLAHLDFQFKSSITTLYSTNQSIRDAVLEADMVIGAVLLPGAKAPKLVTRDMVKAMKRGSVIVDVAIDQGGCIETSRPTTHEEPSYLEEEVVHYCVTNMPGGVARTSTFALNNATLPYILNLAELGIEKAVMTDKYLADGVNVWNRTLTQEAVAAAQGLNYTPIDELLIH